MLDARFRTDIFPAETYPRCSAVCLR